MPGTVATTMDTLISLGTTAAFGWSLYALFFGDAGHLGYTHPFELALMRGAGEANIYFEAVAGIVVFLLLGRYIEARSKAAAGEAVRALLHLGATEATLLVDGVERQVPIDRLAVGDLFVVRPGEKVATDGEVVEGFSAIDNSLVTGESVPVDVAAGTPVIGATLNTTGRLVVRATRVGRDTQLAHIARLVEEAQTGKARVQALADRISSVFVPTVLVLAALTLGTWLLRRGEPRLRRGGSGGRADHRLPVRARAGHADGTAGRHRPRCAAGHRDQGRGGARAHPRGRHHRPRQDRDGDHRHHVRGRRPARSGGTTEAELLRYAGAAEAGSEHPIARAIAAHADSDLAVTTLTNTPGQGIAALVDGREVRVGRPDWVVVGNSQPEAPVGPPQGDQLDLDAEFATRGGGHRGGGGLGRPVPRLDPCRGHGEADVGRGRRRLPAPRAHPDPADR